MKKLLIATTAFAALVAAPALAADMAPPVYKAAPPAPPPAPTWTGCYIGATAGGVAAKSNFTWAPNPAGFPVSGPDLAATGTGSATGGGFTGGGEVGCNYQAGVFVVGGEADIEYTGINITRNVTSPIFGVPITESTKSNWLSTYRARAGVTSGAWLFYVTGGFAFAQFNIADSAVFAASATNNTVATNNTKGGWTAGGGVEWMFAPQWSVKAEYLYVNLGNETETSANSNPVVFPASLITHTHSLRENIGRVGVNFHF